MIRCVRCLPRLAGLLILVFTALSAASPVAAQDMAQDGETTASGTFRSRGTAEDGSDEFFEGVVLTATNDVGEVVASATTGPDGAWLIALPGAGVYTITVDETTLPEGVPLREGSDNFREVTANVGRDNPVLFPLGEVQAATGGSIKVVQLLVDGLKLGLIIGMTAIGLSLIFGTTGLVNFAHGEMVTFGAMVAFLLNVTGVFGVTLQLLVAGLLTVVITGLAGGLFNEVVWRPLRRRGSSLISMLVVSIGLSILFRYVMLYFFGGRGRTYKDYQVQSVIDFGPFTMAPRDVVIMVFSAVVLAAVGTLLRLTRIGKAMRAVADNKDLAESSGIDVEFVIRYVWVAGAALAGLGGVLFGATEDIGWEMGFRLLLLMFAGVTLGGLGTAYGALLGSLVVGVFIQMSTLVVPSDMKNVGALLTLILILLVRPQGLLGKAERLG
jgi:neutral amino acid transport system permease protein